MNYCNKCGHELDDYDYGDRVETTATTDRIANAVESIVTLMKIGNQLMKEIKESNVNASSLVIEYGKQFRSEMQREVGALAEQARLAAMESVTAEFRPVTTKSGEHISILDFELKKKPKKHTLRAKK